MKKFLLLSVAMVAFGLVTQAQDYKNAIGGRLGTTYYDVFSASFKTFITTPGALEFNVGVGGKKYPNDRTFAVSGSAAYQHHFPIGNIEGFKWYVGGGLMVYQANNGDNGNRNGFGFGVFPTGGIDYKIKSIPLAVSADYRPTIIITAPGAYNAFAGNFGIAARYTF